MSSTNFLSWQRRFGRGLVAAAAENNADVTKRATSVDGQALAVSHAESSGDGDADSRSLSYTWSGTAIGGSFATAMGPGSATNALRAEAMGTGDANIETIAIAEAGDAVNVIGVSQGEVVASLSMAISTEGDVEVKFTGLPTADPLVENALWNNAGVLTISSGA